MITIELLMKLLIKKKFKYKHKNFKKYFFFFKNNFFFFKKLFSMFIKNGLKIRVINMFVKFVNILKIKKKARKLVSIYMYQVFKKIIPILEDTSFFKRGSKILVPKADKGNFKKLSTISSLWFKKSVYLRKEKTLFLKIISEIESIRNNNSHSLYFKKIHYLEFYKNKHFIKIFKKKSWI